MYYGYHRTSTKEQRLDRGVAGIEDFCRQRGYELQKIYTDKISGKIFDRPRYVVLKEDVLRWGDTLILWELDRLGRNKKEIINELRHFSDNGIRIMFIDIPTTTMDYSGLQDDFVRLLMDTVNNILIEIVSMVAENEVERKRKRCDEGREAMKARGDWDKYGRPRKMQKEDFAAQYARVVNKEIGSLALMRELGIHRDTYFRYVREYKANSTQIAFGNVRQAFDGEAERLGLKDVADVVELVKEVRAVREDNK
ncbi:MAG: recombinase family protein [Synergistaceae bacterium]|nr:recombinase family protein [Synergistaceae bacterium]